MGRLLWSEIIKTFLKKRTYLGFLIVLLVIPIVEWAFKLEGGRFLRASTRNLSADFLILGNLFNGWFVAYQVMNALWIHVPLLITFVAGDMLAGEATAGTYRLILIKPVSRTRILFVKYITTMLYVVLFVSFIGLVSLSMAIALLGTGDLVVFSRGILVLPEADVAWRFFLAYILAFAPMMTIASIAFFMSSFVENSIGPIIGTMGIVIVLTIITVLPVEAFNTARTYLFTYHMVVWQKAFHDPVPWNDIALSVTNLMVYAFAAVAGTWFVFNRKDILS